ncbi:dihydrodipicolinate synthase 2 [Boeremia exigua]|uniref:dihydrodipicolinate synthase 2 n=1 Tax=Boeremia exigua TaxID=749465 RepID=UPI001E8D7F56|nr:dihydrodipicolinate synthase 2 [Boeremia exigua]KAH6637502.1 dihydrodipicolinate synthase 2 [Boeremia exigua]
MAPNVPASGIWVPAVTFFDPETGRIDLAAQKKYFTYLKSTGLAGLVVLGSNAEALLLTRDERIALTVAARQAVGPDFPLMVGVSGFSVIQVQEYIDDAKKAGADYGLLLPSAYYAGATTKDVVYGFYDEVAKTSPLPLVIYNFPGVANGVDLDSITIAALAKAHPGRIVGVKLTCGSVAKITRLSAELPADTFATFAGQADFLVGGLASGASGCITGFGNVFPKTVVRIYDLYRAGDYKEALALHRRAALAESPAKAGIASVKYAVSQYSAVAAGIESPEAKLAPRKPYVPVAEPVKAAIKAAMEEVAGLEKGF